MDSIKSLNELESSIRKIISNECIDAETAKHLTNQMNNFKNYIEQQEKTLIEQEKLAMVGDIAASVAHEINTPLLAAVMCTSKLKKAYDIEVKTIDEEKFNKYISLLESSLSRIKQQSINLKSLVKYQDGTRVFNIVEELECNLSLLGFMLMNINLNKGYDPNSEILIDGNSGQLNQVFVNIIKNAIESIPADRDGSLSLNIIESDNEISINITDNGVGIKQANIDRLFKDKFTTKEKGTGIGLKLCKDIIDRHNGSIQIDSTVGNGTTFTIRLNKHRGD